MRSDAARNTARVIEEARRAVAAGETDLSLNALARRAGVGVGTVYRVFPTQRAMVEAVVEDAVTDLTRTATEAARDHDALRGRERFLRTAFDVALTRPGLFDALISLDNDRESLTRAKGALMAAVSDLLRRGDEPPVVTGENLLKLLCGVVHAVGEHAADRRQAAADVYFTVLLRGLEHATAAEDPGPGHVSGAPTPGDC